MKKGLLIVLGFLSLSASTVFADCYSSCSQGRCDEVLSTCQCTDPTCSTPVDSNCLSKSACCEAFGNIGAR